MLLSWAHFPLNNMADKHVWLITGAGRGLGLAITKAALAAGHSVVATGHHPEKVTQAIGAADNLLVVKLDVTQPAEAEAAIAATVARFGRLDVLVNNAASLYAGYFEDLRPAQIEQNLATNL
jgi:NAD(P)-dependent dehydrogenase (short-subunit alcohol dehydrogenase family)